ncbi:hypothetical protein GUJ93_ZPchr0004g39496 [Zizania palustris]|uniref:Uncharacterized protein n=1 Tax=Zizania palustris TaxID=103762 RepID=A0A8J5T1N3_ZIZPA|nr:hypothetical protein GUJ93_ZPchr0004g39496 [Zizania palustris]
MGVLEVVGECKGDGVAARNLPPSSFIPTDDPGVGLISAKSPQNKRILMKKYARKKKGQPVAKRFSTRIKRDGITIQEKAQQRARRLNDISVVATGVSSSEGGVRKMPHIAACSSASAHPHRRGAMS